METLGSAANAPVRGTTLRIFPLPDRTLSWLVFVGLLSALSFACFRHVAHHGVVNHDDLHYLTQSARISEAFSNLLDPEYHGPRPIADVVFWLGYEWWGDQPGPYHLLVVFFHAIASILLAVVCRRLGLALEASFLAGTLFLTTVAHFRNLYLISGLSYPLALTFGFVAILLYRRSHQPVSVWLFAFPFMTLLAVLSHPAVVAVMPFCLFTTFNRSEGIKPSLSRSIPAGLVSLGAIFCLVFFYPHKIQTYHTVHAVDLSQITEHFLWLVSRLITTAHWLPLAVYEYREWELAVGVLGLIAAVPMLARRGTPVADWTFWTLVTTLPFVNRLPRSFEVGSSGPSHYLYLASVGVSVLLAISLLQIGNWTKRLLGIRLARITCALIAAAIVIYSLVVIDRLQAFSFFNSGRFHLTRSEFEEGIGQLRKVVGDDAVDNVIPREEAYISLAYGVIRKGDNPDSSVREGLQKFPDSHELHAVLGAVQTMASGSDSREQGVGTLRWAQELASRDGSEEAFNPMVAMVYQFIAEGHNRGGDYGQAIRALEQSLQYATSAKAYFSMGVANYYLSRYHEALAAYLHALELEPGVPEMYSNLGLVYAALGRHGESTDAYQKSIQLRPDFADPHYNLGLGFAALGRQGEAIASFNRAIVLAPRDAETRFLLARIYHDVGDTTAARQQYERLKSLDDVLAGELLRLIYKSPTGQQSTSR